MNTIKKYTLLHLFLLLCQPNCNTMDNARKASIANSEAQQKRIVEILPFAVAAGIAAKACKLSPFGILSATRIPSTIREIRSEVADNNTKVRMVETDYPYAQQWYDNLVKKHPEAQFEKSKLLHNNRNGSKATAGIHKIYLDQNSVQNLNTSYERKIKGINCTADEEEKMSELEWILLHEASHTKHNDAINIQAITLGATAATEALYQLHKKRNPVIPTPTAKWSSRLYSATKRMPKRVGVFASMAIISTVPGHSYSSRAERKADDFAIQHADMHALRAAANYFKTKHEKEQSFIDNQPDNEAKEFAKADIANQEIFDTHPPKLSRIAKIEDEIARREEVSKTSSSK